MKRIASFVLFLYFSASLIAQVLPTFPVQGFESRIKSYVDSLPVFDTHEHLFNPDILKDAGFLDFSLLFLEYGFDDLTSSGMPDTIFKQIFSASMSPAAKWKLLEPYWNNSFNTANNRILLNSVNDIYKINHLDSSTVGILSSRMKNEYSGDWFDNIIHNLCKIDYIVQDGEKIRQEKGYVKYAQRFNDWLLVRTKYTIDSIALTQEDPIYTLDGFVKSMAIAYERAYNYGMTVTKINLAYERTLDFVNVPVEGARKIFKTLVSGNEDMKLSPKDAKPLQDYMVFQLLSLARDHHIPVAIHTGLQAGNGNYIRNSDPSLLSNLFMAFPDVRFVLFHGSYPYGGELSTLAKNFRNVYVDMNWTYSISPAYAARYLNEWLETVPANKIMAFGGDQRMVEMTYGSVMAAKKVITDVLTAKVRDHYFSEDEAKKIARLILHDNGMKFYNFH